ncbi:AAA family ATPase [Streptomyces sp. NBC_00828]|uniref:AAA family ATPase n=1 Tax=Streptomyces sp. NBC_00828 TaxID=2903678 RepID=UPI003863D829
MTEASVTPEPAGVDHPFGTGAPVYAAAGWAGVIPVDREAKKPARSECTGHDGFQAKAVDSARWITDHGTCNLGLRLEKGLIGIDVDAYNGKRGDETIAALEKELGELPPTCSSTARGEGPSRIRLYWMPQDWIYQTLATKLTAEAGGESLSDVEIVQRHHRFVQAWPSVHQKTGSVYRWYRPDGSLFPEGEVPRLRDFAALPEAWVAHLTKRQRERREGDGATVKEFIAAHTEALRPRLMAPVVDSFTAVNGSRHDSMRDALCWGAREAAAGLYAAGDVFGQLGDAYAAALHDDRENDFEALAAFACAAVCDEDIEAVKERHGMTTAAPPKGERLRVTRASAITVKVTKWLWKERLARATLALLAGREDIGKSTVALTVAAQLTRGTLPGDFEGSPKSVVVVATEDAWEQTISPRLMAAGGDLDRVLKVDAISPEGFEEQLCLPADLAGLKAICLEEDVALIILDPLMSAVDSKIDTHKDREIRKALDPLVRLAGAVDASVLGLIHHNKSSTTDPLTAVMGGKAFAAVARTVLTASADPDDDGRYLLSQSKNNLGRKAPSLIYTIHGCAVAETEDGTVWASKIKWGGEDDRTAADVMEAAAARSGDGSAAGEAAEWMADFLSTCELPRADVIKAGRAESFSESALKRAAKRLKVVSTAQGFPRTAMWALPPHSLNQLD